MGRRIALVANALAGIELQAGQRDAKRIHQALLDAQLGACSVESPPPLLDCPSRDSYQASLLKILDNWQQEDQLVAYFSGHGKVVNGRYTLVFGDETKSMLPFDGVIADLNAYGVVRAILVVDACESGAAIEAGTKTPTTAEVIPEDLPRGVAVLASSRRMESSYELPDGSASLFTHLLLEAIETGLDGRSTTDNFITVGDIYAFIQDRLRHDTYSVFPQTPIYRIEGASRELWISKNRTRSAAATNQAARSVEELRFIYERTANSRHPCIGADHSHLDLSLVDTFASNAGMGALDQVRISAGFRRLGLYSPIDPEYLHKAAVLCFGTRPDIFVPQARSIFVVGNRAEKGFRRENITGPLPVQFRRLIDAVESVLARRGFHGDPISRLFFDVVREAISNAVAHRDYTQNGVVRVIVRLPSVEIVSPGGFPCGENWESLLNGEHFSTPVDAAIAWYLTNVLAFEGVGRGFEVYEEYIKATSAANLECEEVKGTSIRLRVTLHEELIRGWQVDDRASVAIFNRDQVGEPRQGTSMGRYELIRTIGRGGMSTVYEAVDPALRRRVALKVISMRYESSRDQKMLYREAITLAKLNHPWIVQVFDVGITGAEVFIVMELIDGLSLDRWCDCLKYDPPRYFSEVSSVAAKVAQAVGYAHEAGVIHRDIKPSNVLMDANGNPHVVDFGIALQREPSAGDITRNTRTGELFGTPAYMSPEQVFEPSKIDFRSDIYSLGVVLWELLVREHPHKNGTFMSVLSEKRGAMKLPSSVNPDIPSELDDIVRTATRFDAHARYGSAKEMGEALDKFVLSNGGN